MKTKNLAIKVKAAGEDGGLEEGQIEAYASIFNNRDSYGDVMRKGSFAGSLKEWADSGRTMPLLWGHNMSDPNMNLGGIFDAKEDEKGLRIKADFDLDNPTSSQVYRLVKSGRVSELSFAFDYLKYEDVEPDSKDNEFDGQYYRNVLEVKLYECSIVPIGATPETEVLAVKSALDALTHGSDRSDSYLKSARGILVSALEDLDKITSAKEQSSGHGSTRVVDLGKLGKDEKTEDTDAKSGFNPSDPLISRFDFLAKGN